MHAAPEGASVPKGRAPAFDILRAGAALLVVAAHAAAAYMAEPMRGFPWAVQEPGSRVFDWVVWSVTLSLMPLFFLVSGYFSAGLYDFRGSNGFLASRRRRILTPFLLGAAALLPLCYAVWCFGWIVSGRSTLEEAVEFNFRDPSIEPNLYGPAHLWFLEYLVLFNLLFWASRRLRQRFGPSPRAAEKRKGWRAALLDSPARPFWLALPTTLLLAADLDSVTRIQNTFLPSPFRLLHFFLFFLIGIWFWSSRSRRSLFAIGGGPYLLLSLPLSVWMARALGGIGADPVPVAGRFALAASVALFVWLTVFGLLSLSLRFFRREVPIVRFLSGASYWIYLAHLPVVALTQVLLFRSALPAGLKFLGAWACGIFLPLAVYGLWVRARARSIRKPSGSRAGLFQGDRGHVASALEPSLRLLGE